MPSLQYQITKYLAFNRLLAKWNWEDFEAKTTQKKFCWLIQNSIPTTSILNVIFYSAGLTHSSFFTMYEAVLYVSKHTQKATGFFHLLAVMKLRTFVNVPSKRARKWGEETPIKRQQYVPTSICTTHNQAVFEPKVKPWISVQILSRFLLAKSWTSKN